MRKVTLSSKYEIRIPKKIRERMNLRPGQTFQLFEENRNILLVPERPMGSMRGFAKGINTEVPRDPDRV